MYQHIPSKIHVQEEKNPMQKKEIFKRPQRSKMKRSKIMWIPKILIQVMHLKEKSQLASIPIAQKTSFIHNLSKSLYTHPPFPPFILSHYTSYPTSPILHLPNLILVLIFLLLHFLLNLVQHHHSHYLITL